MLTERGMEEAEAMRALLPVFARIISSDFDRTIMTAKLLTGEGPEIDHRAAYATTSAEISNKINTLAQEHNISFLDAARQYNDPTVLDGIEDQARILNILIDELLEELAEGEKALVVSHDLTIVPAMSLRDMTGMSIAPLAGFIVSTNDGIASVRHYEHKIKHPTKK